MRSLTLLALTALAALPLSAHDHWRDRGLVVEPCRTSSRWEARRWEHPWGSRAYHWPCYRYEDRVYFRGDGCDEGRAYLRPPVPPLEGRVVLHFH